MRISGLVYGLVRGSKDAGRFSFLVSILVSISYRFRIIVFFGAFMTRRFCLASFLVWHSVPFASFSQKTDPALQPLAFLSGRWTSDSSEGQEEEYWSPVTGRSMVGTFRVSKDGDAVFYEFWVIEVEDGRAIFKGPSSR
jgi:putative Ca2+/H+ antiporter (TMEM165/GDT1 family)